MVELYHAQSGETAEVEGAIESSRKIASAINKIGIASLYPYKGSLRYDVASSRLI
jgi:hypothetical protein